MKETKRMHQLHILGQFWGGAQLGKKVARRLGLVLTKTYVVNTFSHTFHWALKNVQADIVEY